MLGFHLDDIEAPFEVLLPTVAAIESELVSPLFDPCALEQNHPSMEWSMLAPHGVPLESLLNILVLSGQPAMLLDREEFPKLPPRGLKQFTGLHQFDQPRRATAHFEPFRRAIRIQQNQHDFF